MNAASPFSDDAREAAQRIAGVAVRTPLVGNPYLDELVGGRVLLKCENLQRTGSFKFRGAYAAASLLTPAERAAGVVAVSSGNHAQGVAEAARLVGASATIVMPADAPAIKKARTARGGARIVDYDRATEDRDTVVRDYIARHGGTLIHPYDDSRVIAGQATAGIEIAEDAAARGISLDAVLVPCSGGGLSAGIALAIRALSPSTETHIVEPAGFDDYARSLKAGEILSNPRASGSVCDALMAMRPGALGFALNQRNVSGALAVSDEAALAAVAFAFRELKLVVEPGGAVALAAILSGVFPVRGKTVVAVLSGGNIDEPVLQRALAAYER
ncbi:MAG: threonine/serine dehydratase [Bauldia sp.]|nr:threonine/serine dehydratase [Bauldia sp.]